MFTENETFSHSIHICSADEVFMCYMKHQPSPANQQTSKNKNIEKRRRSSLLASFPTHVDVVMNIQSKLLLPDISIVTWRTIVTKGKPPRGRYLHTATYVQIRQSNVVDIKSDVDNENKPKLGANNLIIYGGLGKGHKPLNDVFSLDLDTFTWTQLQDPMDLLNQQNYHASDDIPPVSGVYSHVAFAVNSFFPMKEIIKVKTDMNTGKMMNDMSVSSKSRIGTRRTASFEDNLNSIDEVSRDNSNEEMLIFGGNSLVGNLPSSTIHTKGIAFTS